MTPFGDKPIKTIFMGDRRIAWEALKLLSSPSFAEHFELRALVTSADIAQACKRLLPAVEPRILPNDRRLSNEILDVVAAENIQLLLSVQYNWILPPTVLDAVERRAFNLHNARLPDYKGYNSISHAILNDDVDYLSTVHWMDEVVDVGDIAYLGRTPIGSGDTAHSLYNRTIDAAVGAFASLLRDLRTGRPVPRIPMDRHAGAFYPRDSLKALVDVSDVNDEKVVAKIARAVFFPPYNTAYRTIDGQKVLIIPDGSLEAAYRLDRPANQPDLTL